MKKTEKKNSGFGWAHNSTTTFSWHIVFILIGASQGSAWQIPKVWKQISLKITGCSHHQPVTTNQSGIFASLCYYVITKILGGSLS